MVDAPRAAPGPEDLLAAGEMTRSFGLDLLQRLPSGNAVVSPTSIVTALAMARAGARGETATEMDRVLRAAGLEDLLAAMNALDLALAGRSRWILDDERTPREVSLRSVNAPFGQQGYGLDPAYLELLAAGFGAGLRLVDYVADPDGARRLINAWVAERTEQRIEELLGSSDVTAATRLVLVNAIYLKAPWAVPFPAKETAPAPFTRADGSTVQVPMMRIRPGGLGTNFLAGEGEGWRAVRLPYLGQELAMTVIVPDDLATFERGLDATAFADILAAYDERETGQLGHEHVDLWLPRFSTETSQNLAELLISMGMPLAFDPAAADFSGITAEDRLFIARVIHQANIDVDEKGTEAAAATAVVMDVGGPGDEYTPFVVHADRPFLYAITDVASGAVLFLGRVTDPLAG